MEYEQLVSCSSIYRGTAKVPSVCWALGTRGARDRSGLWPPCADPAGREGRPWAGLAGCLSTTRGHHLATRDVQVSLWGVRCLPSGELRSENLPASLTGLALWQVCGLQNSAMTCPGEKRIPQLDKNSQSLRATSGHPWNALNLQRILFQGRRVTLSASFLRAPQRMGSSPPPWSWVVWWMGFHKPSSLHPSLLHLACCPTPMALTGPTDLRWSCSYLGGRGVAQQLGSPQPPGASGGVCNRVLPPPYCPPYPRVRGASLLPHQTGCAFIL